MPADVTPPAFDLLSDRYLIEHEIGRGGMATVYLAHDVKHGRQVAIKVMTPEMSAAIGRDRFLREIEIAARLNHPHIVPLFDSGAAGDLLYYVMPYIAGESLRARMTREQQISVEDALRLTREIASALGHAHQQDLVHRDIKPENVLLVDGMALVTDFGIARSMTAAAPDHGTQFATMAGSVLGTPQYMSPEQASGREADQRSDIYSLTCVLFEMLTGHPPFVAATPDALLRMHVTVTPLLVTETHPSAPDGVARVVARGLAKMPEDRFENAAQFAEALSAAITDVTTLSGASRDVSSDVSRSAPRNNLPRPRTTFIGRQKDVDECLRLLGDTRVLTLTGIGGGGKTRLAIRVAEQALHDYPDGTWFVDLAPLNDPGRVIEAVAAALGVREAAGKDLRTSLQEHVRERRLLLVFDNCEHLLSPVAEIADGLLEAGDGLRILVTSREGLGIEGERLLAVRSLAAPDQSARNLAVIASSDAVQLFVDRARRVLREFALDDDNAGAVADICRRLDGIPLAIELAAARVKLLSIEQIRSRLDDRFRLLTGGSRTALPRQQTLQATIQWSYDQLAPDEQHLLRVLSVFAGGWTLDTAARVSGDDTDEFHVLDLMSRLVDKSLVLVVRDETNAPRYRLLETVRQYAAERMLAADDTAGVRRRHAEAFLPIAERAYEERVTCDDKWSAVLEAEHDNLRAGLAFLRETNAERYLQLAGALGWFWQTRSHLFEGREHLTAALAAAPAAPVRKVRARALWAAANLLLWHGDASGSVLMGEALQMWRDLGDLRETAAALEGMGWAQFISGEDEQARATFEESLRLQRASGDPHLVTRALVALGQALVALDRVDEARAVATEIVASSQTLGDRRSEHSGWHYLADCALLEGECAAALGLYRQSLVIAREIKSPIEIGFEVQGIAMCLAGLGDVERSLLLAASVEAENDRLGSTLRVRFWDALHSRYLGQARAALTDTDAERVWTRGRALPLDQAAADALDAASEPRS